MAENGLSSKPFVADVDVENDDEMQKPPLIKARVFKF
jgi:hypothetical protein